MTKTKIGVLMRVYSRDPKGVPDLVETVTNAILYLRQRGVPLIFLAVWCDPGQPDSDCGLTAAALHERFGICASVHIVEVRGDLFVDALNGILPTMVSFEVTHVFVLSVTAVCIITPAVLSTVEAAISAGAKAVALVHPEFPDLVRRGYLTNTHAVWDLGCLTALGGFDAIDRRPVDFDPARHIVGVGEAMNVIKLYRVHGSPILAIIDPIGVRGDTRIDKTHRNKIATKWRRSVMMLHLFGSDWKELAATIMPGYPIQV